MFFNFGLSEQLESEDTNYKNPNSARDIIVSSLKKTEERYRQYKKGYFNIKIWLLVFAGLTTLSSALNGNLVFIPIFQGLHNRFYIGMFKLDLNSLTTFLGICTTFLQGYLSLWDPHTEWLKKFKSYMGLKFELNRYDACTSPYTDEQTKNGILITNMERLIRSSLWSVDNRE
jgi:hypothetical protein